MPIRLLSPRILGAPTENDGSQHLELRPEITKHLMGIFMGYMGYITNMTGILMVTMGCIGYITNLWNILLV